MDINTNLSVVIPSLGEVELCLCIQSLIRSTYKPSEVVIVLPHSLIDLAIYPLPCKCNVLYSHEPGQTRQRLFGINSSLYEYILQCDSTIIFEPLSIERLFRSLKSLPGNALISPVTTAISDVDQYYSLSSTPNDITLLSQDPIFIDSLPHDYLLPFGYPRSPYRYSSNSAAVYQTHWVNGVVLYHKSNALYFNHFPFLGKSYSEDLIASYYFKRKGCSLWIDNSACCFSKGKPEFTSLTTFLVYFRGTISSKCYLASLHSSFFIPISFILSLIFLLRSLFPPSPLSR